MEPLSGGNDLTLGLVQNELSKLLNNLDDMKNLNNSSHTVDSASIWTSGTRKQCNGQYSWCFTKPIPADYMPLYSQTLASSSNNGACVLATRNSNKVKYAFINEDCNTKATNMCFFIGQQYLDPSFVYVRI
jgi:hypothetical protein